MNILINAKSIGKRKNAPTSIPYSLPANISTLSGLIAAIVNIEVSRYNSKEPESVFLPYLTESDIENQSTTGKVGFGSIYSNKKANAEKAVEVALQGFEDGLFRVTINGEEIKELESPVTLEDGDVLTFIRLTFLAGRLW